MYLSLVKMGDQLCVDILFDSRVNYLNFEEERPKIQLFDDLVALKYDKKEEVCRW